MPLDECFRLVISLSEKEMIIVQIDHLSPSPPYLKEKGNQKLKRVL